MGKLVKGILPVLVTLAVLEIGTRVLDSQVGLLPPGNLGFSGLSRQASGKGYNLFEATDQGSYLGHTIRINALGLRGPEFDLHRERDAVRLLFLGDSLTFGHGVAEEEAWPNRVTQALSRGHPETRFVAVNLSHPGANHLDERHMLLDFFDRVAPHAVFVGFCDNDVTRTAPVSLEVHNRYWKTLWAVTKALQRLLLESGLIDDYFDHVRHSFAPEGEDWAAFRETVSTMGRLGREASVPIAVLYLDWAWWYGKQSQESFLEGAKKSLADEFERNGMAFVDTTPVIVADGSPSYAVSPWDAHPDARAHGLYADALLEYLAESGMEEQLVRKPGSR